MSRHESVADLEEGSAGVGLAPGLRRDGWEGRWAPPERRRLPTPGVTPFHDPRQHAVALSFVVPVRGDCAPQQDALDLAWLTPEEAGQTGLQAEMSGGHGVLLRQALAHLGRSAF